MFNIQYSDSQSLHLESHDACLVQVIRRGLMLRSFLFLFLCPLWEPCVDPVHLKTDDLEPDSQDRGICVRSGDFIDGRKIVRMGSLGGV